MLNDPLSITTVLVTLVALSEWLTRRTCLRHLGAALLVIILTAIVANLKLIPTYGPQVPVYGEIFEFVAPLGIFWLLLLVDLKSLRKVGGPTLTLFLVGAAGTVMGALVADWVVNGARFFGPLHAALGGMFAGTYTGGSLNFNAVALEYRVMEDSALYAGAAAVDNAITAVWMAACVGLPRLLAGVWPGRKLTHYSLTAPLQGDDEIETTTVFDMAVVIALGVGAVSVSGVLAAQIQNLTGLAVPSILVLTTLALILAQFPAIKRLKGARLLGLFSVYLFLAVIGALCDVEALVRIGELAPVLGLFVCILIGVHGLLVFGTAWVLKIDPATAAVASQANIGGGTSALALARSLGRADLELPAILAGSIGTAAGSYLGFLVAAWLGS